MDYMEDVRDEYPNVYRKTIKKSGNEFISEVNKMGDILYKKMSDENDKELLEFYHEVTNFGTIFTNWLREL